MRGGGAMVTASFASNIELYNPKLERVILVGSERITNTGGHGHGVIAVAVSVESKEKISHHDN